MKQFECLTKICMGSEGIDCLRSFGAERILIVTDSYFSKNGKAIELEQQLFPAKSKIFDRITGEPSLALAAEGAAICCQFQPDLIVALGGGSALDCAKGILYAWDQNVPLAAIPTSSGSGSELTSYAVLRHNGNKIPLVASELRPAVAVLDDQYLKDLPKSLIANAGMDVLAHCLEALAATKRNEFTDALALHAAQCVFEKLESSHRGDRSVRMQLHQAASMAGLAFDQAGLGICHALAHAIGGTFSVPHGSICAILLPDVLKFNGNAAKKQYVKLAKRCGMSAATDGLALRSLINAVEQLRRGLRLPESMQQAGISREEWEKASASVVSCAIEDPCCKSNPVPVTEADLLRICRAVIA